MSDMVQWLPHDDSATHALEELRRKFDAQVVRLDENERAAAAAENALRTAEAKCLGLRRSVAAFEAANKAATEALEQALVKCPCEDAQCPVCMLLFKALSALAVPM